MAKMLNLFSNRSIAAKLAAMTIVGAICMALVAATVLLIARGQVVTERTEKAHAIVDDGRGSEEAVLRSRRRGLV